VIERLLSHGIEAERLLSDLLSRPEANAADKAMAHALRGLLAIDRSDTEAAADALRNAQAIGAMRTPRPDVLAAIERLRGRMQLQREQFMDAAASFDREVAALKQWELHRAVPWALAEAARAYAAAHKPHEAAERFYLAARTAAGLGNDESRQEWAKAASAIAPAEDVELKALCDALTREGQHR
jgi:hypothetical protein